MTSKATPVLGDPPDLTSSCFGESGYPTKKGDGRVGDARIWEIDVGRMSQNLYFYQISDM